MKEYTKAPKVSLVSYTENAIPLMCWARRVMHNKVPDNLEELKKDPKKWLGESMDDYVNNVLMNDGMPTFLEYIGLTFKLENVSRALTHQLVRHRIGFSYSQQSMRCVSAENFASDGLYHMPKTVKDKLKYHKDMLEIQKKYREALKNGVSIQDARGLLPTNIYTTITFSCSLRAFIGMINKRLCLKTQGEFRDVADLMNKEIENKLDKRIMKWIGPPCKFGYCIMKGENEEQLRNNKFSGIQNTDHVCPLYVERFINKKKDGI
jgi:thymidylate synthase (FAD)